MQRARICRAAFFRISAPGPPVARLRRHSTSEPIHGRDDKSRHPYGTFDDAFYSKLYPTGGPGQLAKEPGSMRKRKPWTSIQHPKPSTSVQAPVADGPPPVNDPSGAGNGQSKVNGFTPPGNRPRHPASRPRRQTAAHIMRTFKPSSIKPLPQGASTEVKQRWHLRMSIYHQWGYIRHQLAPSEVLPAKRAFKSWKAKLGQVLDPVNYPSVPWLHQVSWLLELDTVAAMRVAWGKKDGEIRRREWPLTMLSIMHICPSKVSMFLDATLGPELPGYAIHDVLLFVVQRFHLEDGLSKQERTAKADDLLDFASKIVEDMPVRHVPFGQRTFGFLAKKLPCEQAEELFALLERNGCRLHGNTLLQFAAKFASDGAYKSIALEIVEKLADNGMDLNGAGPSSVITSLLHCKAPEDGGEHEGQSFSPTKALERLVEKGLSPNVISATAFLDSLCQQHEVEEAIRLALLFAECGTQLDTKTWVAVFRGAKNSLNVANVVKALDVAKVANAPYVDVLNNLLHSIFYFAMAESRERQLSPPWPTPVFLPMLHVYAKKFDLEPLQWWLPDLLPAILAGERAPQESERLGAGAEAAWTFPRTVVPAVDDFFSGGGPARLQPNMTTIALMLRSYIRSMSRQYDLVAYYGFFKARLEEEGRAGSLARALVREQGSLIHDAFILAMSEHQLLTRQALQVFGDMLKDHLPTDPAGGRRARAGGDGIASATPIHPCPSVLTFTILLRSMMNRGEHVLANRILRFMDEAGVKANIVTWNTLIDGYASLQNIKRTVETLQDMEAAGFQPDTFTFKAFARLDNQGIALKMLQGILDENKKKLMEQGPAPVVD